MTTINQPLYCVRTADGLRNCAIVRDNIYDYKSIYPLVEVKAVDGRPFNAINRIIVPSWKVTLKEVTL